MWTRGASHMQKELVFPRIYTDKRYGRKHLKEIYEDYAKWIQLEKKLCLSFLTLQCVAKDMRMPFKNFIFKFKTPCITCKTTALLLC